MSKYVPSHLSKSDKKIQKNMLKKSKKEYKRGVYSTRKKLKSFKGKESKHMKKLRKMYKVDKIVLGSRKSMNKLAKTTGCSVRAMKEIAKKGMGAYYSQGSRPNQSAHSWGIARLASSLTGGNAVKQDIKILRKGCSKRSRALKLAEKTFKK